MYFMVARTQICLVKVPRGSIYTTIMELVPQNHNGDGLSWPNSIIVVYMDPLGSEDEKQKRNNGGQSFAICIHTCVHTYIHTYIIHIYVEIHIQFCVYLHTQIHTYIHIHVYTCIYICVNTKK